MRRFPSSLCIAAAAAVLTLQSASAQTTGAQKPAPLASSSPASPAAAAPASPAAPGTPAPAADLNRADPSVWLGATLSQIVSLFGAPQSVHALRGPEAWQDDVVFVYDTVELYWFKDKVWQVRANNAYGLRAGDSREAVLAALGEPLQRLQNDFVYQRPSRAWPLRLRVKFAESGGASDFYLYRADF